MARRLWIGGRIEAPLYVTEPEPRRPDFVMWIDTASGKIVAGEIAEPADSTAALAACLSKVLDEGRVKRPDRIRVADASLVEAVRAVVGERVAIEIAPTPEVAEIAQSMGEMLDAADEDTRQGVAPSYFEEGRVAPATVVRLFEVAARLYRVAPWTRLWDADVIGLDIPAFGMSRAALSVLGRGGQNYGFVIFDSASDFDAFGAAGSDPLRRKTDLGASTLSLNFESKSRIPPPMLREILRHGWKVAGPKAYPFVMGVDRDRVHRPLRERDLLLVCAVAEGLARFVAEHGRALSPEMPDPIVEELALDGEEEVMVRLTAPHPEMPWLPDEDDFAAADEDGWSEDEAEPEYDSDGEDDEMSTRLQELADAFVESQRAAGRTSAWLDAARFMAWSLLRYQADYVGGTPEQLTERDAEEFLIDHIPRKVSAEDELIEQGPEALGAFFDWLASRGTIRPEVAAAARKRVSAIRNRFAVAARDPSRYGPAKRIFMQMKAEGVDVEDEVAVRDYVSRYNDRLTSSGSSTLRSSAAVIDKTPRPGRPKLSPRWIPAPGAVPPGKQSPCPCGSGRAYGKCCMPR